MEVDGLRNRVLLQDASPARMPLVVTRSVECVPLSVESVRIANIDRLRIVAALGIVWFHTPAANWRAIGYSGLPIFLLLFASLVTNRSHLDTSRRFLKRRWSRLIVPWLFWSAVYALCSLSKALGSHDISDVWAALSIKTIFVGAHIHLWYLPYAFVWGLILHAVSAWTLRMSHAVVAAGAAVFGLLTLSGYVLVISGGALPAPLSQWAFAAPAIPLGFAIGRCQMIRDERTRRLLLLLIALAGGLVCLAIRSAGFISPAIPYGLATILVCLAYVFPGRTDSIVSWAAPLTFGIYVLHPLVDYGARHFLAARMYPGPFIVSVFCLSALVTCVLLRTPLRRFF